MENFDQVTERNADRLIAQGIKGEGLFGKALIAERARLSQEAMAAYAFQHEGAQATGEDFKKVQKEVDAQLAANAQQLKPAIKKAAQGDTKAAGELDVGQLMGAFGAVNNLTSSASNGSMFGMITAGLALISNSFIGEYVQAGIKYFFGGKDGPKSFGEALADVRMDHGIDTFSKQLGINGADLKSELLKPPAPAGAVASNTSTIDSTVVNTARGAVATKDVTDGKEAGPAGVPPEGGPNVPNPVVASKSTTKPTTRPAARS